MIKKAATTVVLFTAALVEAFGGAYLSPMYDDAQPVPEFHRECWHLYCSPVSNVAIAAPRGHAKSTALTHTFGLAAAVFRVESHILIVSATEDLSMAHLGDMSKELHDNDELRADFGIDTFLVDAKSEIIVRCTDGYEFRIIARGSNQKLRGMKWNGRRPGLILCDDMEEDEQVENIDRRAKFRKWVMRALMPLGRRGCKIRWHGTILHRDAMLSRLMKDASWQSRLYKAHASFSDFTDILWPEMWSEERLREKQAEYVNQFDPGGYSQEYLNDPLDNSEAYIKEEWFVNATENQRDAQRQVCAAADFAISKADKANRTSLTVGGKSVAGDIMPMDQIVGRFDSFEIVEEMFNIQKQWHPDIFWVEKGQIWLAVGPMVRKAMMDRDVYINVVEVASIKDKATRGRPFQRRMRGGGVVWPFEAHWYPGMKDEILHFTGNADATLDDQFDSMSLLVAGFETLSEVEEEDFESDEDRDFRSADPRVTGGRSEITGY
jgi:predicted phage terminase large subunit-like protein